MDILVNLEKDSYNITIKNNLLSDIVPYIANVFTRRRIFIVSDDHVFPLYGEPIVTTLKSSYDVSYLMLKSGEPTKSFLSLPAIYKSLIDANISRSDLLIALGGGVIGDLAGFAAATYLRGIDFVQIPTSLLAQVDSSVGGKVAVDLPQGKNLAGAFYQPRLVLIDPQVLETLPPRFINDGMGEIIKYGCIKDSKLFQLLSLHQGFYEIKNFLPDIIANCINIKRMVVENDPFDKGQRMLLNFGHTLAHAIEQYYHYKRESHGEAVAIGMYQITRFAVEKGLCSPKTSQQILEVLNRYNLPHECNLPMEDLLPAIKRDKKNLQSSLNLILLKDIGHSYIYPSSSDFFHSDQIKII